MTARQTGCRLPWALLGALSIGFHLWLVFSGLIPNLVSRPLHMALALPWVFLAAFRPDVPDRDVSPLNRTLGVMLFAICLPACLWIVWQHDTLGDQYGFLENHFQTAIAAILLIGVLEMARRAIGWPLPLVALLALLYGLLGQYIPGEFGHPGTPLSSFLGTLTIAEGGLWGSLTGVSVSIVAIFVIFGAVLNAGEAGQGFMNLATRAAGRLKGGAAKVSVVSSALFGSISGSASANVASTGTVTLPAMTRLGYPRALAGAVEAVASSGGQIMPPLMGAGAFVMVELTGISYTSIMTAASLPALLYFLAVWFGINGFSRRFDLQPLSREQLPDAKLVLITTGFFLVPFTTLLLGMFVLGRTPQYAACLAIGAGFVLLFFNDRLRPGLRLFAQRLESLCIQSGEQIATIASIILCASIIIGVLGITGLGVKLTSAILSLSGGHLVPALLLTALACLILGMEVPTTAAYVICVSVAGPALTELGLPLLTTHLFVFWFALLSTITPPVCGAVFIAAGMVGENWLKVARYAMALGLGLYLIPLSMISHPGILEIATAPWSAILAAALVAAGLAAISHAITSERGIPFRLMVVAVGCLLLFY
ncbi:TRAP transporter permease [Granulosicoccus sp. 3-233]|uniref:TRAP transporter permease n=1 Tax=Granulosicoccus sp. 3-233 TaxID=3417969 RepID=UPI003D34EB72